MARFTTTIQLHNADEKDYQILHTELKKESFKEIRRYSAASSEVRLQKEEYNLEGNITLQDVADAVLRAAAKTGKKYSFTIIRNKPVYN
jgi:L-rhamnose mutarotase